MRRLVPPCLGIVLLGNAGCPAPALENWSASDPVDPPSSATASGSTTQAGEPTTSTDPQLPTTSSAPGSTSIGSDATGDTASTTGDDLLPPPEIVSHGLSPDPLEYPEPILATIYTKHAETVKMWIDDQPEPTVLSPVQADVFSGEIVFFSAKDNKGHKARFIAYQGDIPSAAYEVPFTVALPASGTELFWDDSPSIGPGHIVALAVTPTHALLELGTYYPMGQPRCYLRRRTLFGTVSAFLDVMPGTACTAKDLAVGPDGAFYVLADRLEDNTFKWWLGKYSAWGQNPAVISTGAAGDQAHSLAVDPARVAVCGTREKVTDLDATAWIFHPNGELPAKTLSFDSDPIVNDDNLFSDIANDCAFAGNDLVLTGHVLGDHEDDDVHRERHFVLVVDFLTEEPPFNIAPPGPGTQSQASAIAIGTNNRYITVGHFCDDNCAARGELRMFHANSMEVWHKLLDPAVASTRDIGWGPADYIVYAGARDEGQGTESFFVEAWIPLHGVPFWSFAHLAGTGAAARTLTFGPYGQVYAGGSTGDGYPALAVIAP